MQLTTNVTAWPALCDAYTQNSTGAADFGPVMRDSVAYRAEGLSVAVSALGTSV